MTDERPRDLRLAFDYDNRPIAYEVVHRGGKRIFVPIDPPSDKDIEQNTLHRIAEIEVILSLRRGESPSAANFDIETSNN